MHKHSCECKHDKVKYCRTCRIVHCEDCNQEWSAKSTFHWDYAPYFQKQYAVNDWGQVTPNKGEVLCKHEG